MNAMDFDALVYKNQGFNTMDNVANSGVSQQLTQQTLQSIQTMQTPTQQGYVPQHVVLPVFQKQAEQQKAASYQFFVALNGQQKGPLTLEQLKGLALCDVIDENSAVWMQGMPNWTDLKTCLSQLKL